MPIYTKSYDVVDNNFGNAKYTQIGKKVRISVFTGGVDLGACYGAIHAFQLADSQFVTSLIKKNFTGGKQVKLVNIANNSLTSVTITINGKVYTFGVDITIGTDSTETETNLQTFLDGKRVTKRTVLAAVIATSQVKITGSDKEVLSVSTSDATKVVITNGTFTAASLKCTFADSIFVAGTPNVLRLGLKTTDSAGKTSPDLITINTLTPSGITTRAELIAAILVMFTAALAGSAPGVDSNETPLGYVNSFNGRTYAQISTALQAVFGSTPGTAFTSDSTSFTLTVVQSAYLGLPGNGIQMEFGVGATEPDLDIVIDENFTILLNGVAGTKINSSRDYDSESTLATGTVPQDNEDLDYTTNKTGSSGKVGFVANDVHRSEIEALLAGAARAYNLSHDIVLPGGATGLPILCVAALIETDVAGKFHFELANIYVTESAPFKGTKSSTDGYKIGGNVIPRSGTAAPGIIKYKFVRAGQS